MIVTNAIQGNEAISGAENNRFSDNSNTNEMCPVRDILDRIGDKWSIHTIVLLGEEGFYGLMS